MGNYMSSPDRTDADFHFGTTLLNVSPHHDSVAFPDTYGDVRILDGPVGIGNSLRLRGGFLVHVQKPMTVPQATIPGDDLRLLMDLKVTNPGQHFGEGNTPAEFVNDEAELCRLQVSLAGTLDPPLIDQTMQPNDDIPSSTPFAVLLEDPGFMANSLMQFSIILSCPQNPLLLADFQIDVMALEIARVASSSTSTEEATTATSLSTTSLSTPTTTISTSSTTTSSWLPTTTADSLTPTPSTSLVAISTTTTSPATITPVSLDLPPTIGQFQLLGCVASQGPISTFQLRETSSLMTAALCVSACRGDSIAGVSGESCYCGNPGQLEQFHLVNIDQCNVACPGNSTQRCGGRALEGRDLWRRQDIPTSMFFTVYVSSRGIAGLPPLPVTTTATTTITTGAGVSTETETVTVARPSPGPYPADRKHPNWWSCKFTACSFDLTVLKPWNCDSGCDGLYYQLICDNCRPGEEYWKPIQCSGNSCRDKTICKPESCGGGYCGEHPIVEEEACNECEGGFSYRPKQHGGEQGSHNETLGVDHDGSRGKHTGVDKDLREGNNGSKKLDENEIFRNGPQGDDIVTENGFVIASGSSNLASLVMIIAGLMPFGIVQFV